MLCTSTLDDNVFSMACENIDETLHLYRAFTLIPIGIWYTYDDLRLLVLLPIHVAQIGYCKSNHD